MSADIQLDEKIKVEIKEPSTFKVIFLNDDYTPMDFVVSLMVEVFKHSEKTAHAITIPPIQNIPSNLLRSFGIFSPSSSSMVVNFKPSAKLQCGHSKIILFRVRFQII